MMGFPASSDANLRGEFATLLGDLAEVEVGVTPAESYADLASKLHEGAVQLAWLSPIPYIALAHTGTVSPLVYHERTDKTYASALLVQNNQLAGAPPHSLYAQADYSLTQAWSAGLGIRWIAEKTPIDNLNTVYSSPYAVVDLRSGYRINKALSIFGEVTNLFDKTYASSTLIVDQARPDQAAFLPGDGRAFYAGLALNF